MRDRLASLSDEARSIRSQVPREFEPDVERIQQQMQRLGERLSELSSGALQRAGETQPGTGGDAGAASAGAAPDEVILLGGPSSDNPWDAESANALTRFYESGEAFCGPAGETRRSAQAQPRASAGAAQRQPGTVAVEAAWLDHRFAEIAHRIEQSLAEIRPESSLLTIGRRFDQLEERMSSALRGVATRADLEQLRVAEVQIEEISTQLDQLRRQLARLDAIDAHLGTLAAQLSDDRLARVLGNATGAGADPNRLAAIDEQLATLVEQLSHDRLADLFSRSTDLEELAKSAARLADHEYREAQARDMGEVRGLIENLINERRHSDENNASMLETMQQAVIRVLDRIDAIELAQQHGDAPAAAAASAPAAAQSAPAYAEQDYEPPHAAPYGQVADEPQPAPQEAPFTAAPFDLDQAFASEGETPSDPFGTAEPFGASEPPPRAIDTLRHDFIADAHRAKIKAASKRGSGAEPSLTRIGDLSAAKEKAAADPQCPRPRRSFFNIRSPRVLMAILTLLAVFPAALFFMPRTPADRAAPAAEDSMLPPAEDRASGAGGAANDAGTPAMPGGEGTTPPTDTIPSKQSEQLVPETRSGANEYMEVGGPHGALDRVDTAALPDKDAVSPLPAFADGSMTATPAALMQERVLRMNGVAPPDDGGASMLAALPPATVGPFSLRLAAAQGDSSAQFEVAARLAQGKGTDQDLKAAAHWFQRSAASGFAMAQFRLGTLYERGVGVKTDLARAKIWYSRAAEQGNVKAMHNLAVLIAGRGDFEPDYATAAHWFTEAAERGVADSQYNLAVLYENGLGVPKDVKQAYKWLVLAAQSGDSEATSRRDALKSQLSGPQLTEVGALVESWRAKPTDPVANDARAAGQAWRQRQQGSRNG